MRIYFTAWKKEAFTLQEIHHNTWTVYVRQLYEYPIEEVRRGDTVKPKNIRLQFTL